MKIRDIILPLLEAPLPEDWDKEIFDPRVPFTKRVAYAKERATRLGQGSSRVAFLIKYQGRDTVLKVAKNNKGMRQNQYEAQILNDWYATSNGITVPMIDYDERSSMPTWIHTEYAPRLRNRRQLQSVFGGIDPSHVETVILQQINHPSGRYRHSPDQETIDAIYDHDIASGIVDLSVNFNLLPADLLTHTNWGIFKGKPVLIDVGITVEMYDELYRKR